MYARVQMRVTSFSTNFVSNYYRKNAKLQTLSWKHCRYKNIITDGNWVGSESESISFNFIVSSESKLGTSTIPIHSPFSRWYWSIFSQEREEATPLCSLEWVTWMHHITHTKHIQWNSMFFIEKGYSPLISLCSTYYVFANWYNFSGTLKFYVG